MPRFFVLTHDIEDDIVTLKGDDAHHVAYSLRLAAGEHITVVCDGTAYDCALESFSPDKSKPWVTARVCGSSPVNTEPPYKAVLYQALPKGDKLDTIIQKAVECGAFRVVPFESSRCIARAKPEAEARKTERRQRISEEAAKQCGRGIIPEILPTVSFSDMLESAAEADLVLFCYEADGTQPLPWVLKDRMPVIPDAASRPTIAVIVGSEGGFSPDEAAEAARRGFSMIGLGKRILRCETAPSFVLGCLSYQYEL